MFPTAVVDEGVDQTLDITFVEGARSRTVWPIISTALDLAHFEGEQLMRAILAVTGAWECVDSRVRAVKITQRQFDSLPDFGRRVSGLGDMLYGYRLLIRDRTSP